MSTHWVDRVRNGWTDEVVEKLRKLAAEGYSASQIARELRTGHTRNAVIGKMTRLGIASGLDRGRETARVANQLRARQQAAAAAREKAAAEARVAKAAAAKVVALPRAPAPPAAEPRPFRCEPAGSAAVLTLASHMCKWPIGDPSSADFTFCGTRATQGAYCARHAAVAFQPTSERRTKDMARSLRRFL